MGWIYGICVNMGRLPKTYKVCNPLVSSKVYERALAHDEQHPDLYYNLGVVHIERGVPDQAWLPDGHSQIFSVCVCVPSGLKDYTHARSPPYTHTLSTLAI